MVRENKAAWKANYYVKVVQLFDEYPKCFIVGADNVGSKQMQQIRSSLRGLGIVLMGKNTMMRKAITGNNEGKTRKSFARDSAGIGVRAAPTTEPSLPDEEDVDADYGGNFLFLYLNLN